jgi:hypothetical protein
MGTNVVEGKRTSMRQNSRGRIQESGVAGVQELENLGAWRRFSQGDAGPGFSDIDLARVFCNSCNF